MIATAFRPVDINQNLLMIYYLLFLWSLVFVFFYLVWRIIFENRLYKLIREWRKNGTAMSNWIQDHYRELNFSIEATISDPEFQELLRKDFEIYNKLVILDPKLKEDQVFNQGRDFYRSLIRTKNST